MERMAARQGVMSNYRFTRYRFLVIPAYSLFVALGIYMLFVGAEPGWATLPGGIGISLLSLLCLVNYSVFSRICVTDDGIESWDWFNVFRRRVLYSEITSVVSEFDANGAGGRFELLVIKSRARPIKICLQWYSRSDIAYLVQAIRERAPDAKMATRFARLSIEGTVGKDD